MHRHLVHHLVLIVALFCISPAIYGFWKSAGVHHSALVRRDNILRYGFERKSFNMGSHLYRSYHSSFRRANDPEVDGEEDLTGNLGYCVPRCILTDTARGTDGTKVKKSNVISNTSCLGGQSSCVRTRGTIYNSTSRLSKRARPLPGFGSDNDLRKKTQQQLNEWIMQRLPDPADQPTDVKLLWDENDAGQWIDLKTYRGKDGEYVPYGIPTSFFEQPGNEAFAYGTIGLVGCSLFIIIKTPTLQDTRSGVYIAHIWE
jgi:hypothetical protein